MLVFVTPGLDFSGERAIPADEIPGFRFSSNITEMIDAEGRG